MEQFKGYEILERKEIKKEQYKITYIVVNKGLYNNNEVISEYLKDSQELTIIIDQELNEALKSKDYFINLIILKLEDKKGFIDIDKNKSVFIGTLKPKEA